MVKYGPSVELCGGTHVHATGEIGIIRILSESSVAAGVRRIEAVSGAKAEELIDIQQDMMREAKNFFSNTPNLLQSIKKSIEENAELKKQVDIFIHEKIGQLKDMLMRNAHEKGDVKIMVLKGDFQAEMVKSVAFQIRNEMNGKMVFIGGTQTNGKPTLTVILSDDLMADGFNATTMVREAAKAIQGGGGGQPFFAQAGGKDVAGLEKALDILTNKF